MLPVIQMHNKRNVEQVQGSMCFLILFVTIITFLKMENYLCQVLQEIHGKMELKDTYFGAESLEIHARLFFIIPIFHEHCEDSSC